MKKIVLFILLIVSVRTVAANTAGIIAGNVFIASGPHDTVPYAIDEEDVLENDSLESFPAYDLYSGWDTVNVHSSKFDVASLKECSRSILLYDDNSCGYVQPFEGRITAPFGPRKKRYHYGVDIDLETGDCVAAAFDGKVRIAKKSKSYGNVIVIRHPNGLETYYAHLSKINVEIGQEIYAGEVIGLGGNTGHSHGSHLHFEVRYMGQPVNPSELISFDQHKLISDTLTLSTNTFSYLSAAKKAAAKNNAVKRSGKIHVVKKGDTLSAIARKYKTTPKALCIKNGLRLNSNLRLGQKIKI